MSTDGFFRGLLALPGAGLRKLKKSGGGAPPYWEDDTKVYRHHEGDMPFAKAAAIVDRRDGYAMQLKRYWQTSCIAMTIVAAFLGAGWWHQGQKSTVKLMVVPVDRLGDPGEVFVPSEYEPTTAIFAAAVERVVKTAFSRSSDENVNEEAYQYLRQTLSSQAVQRWNEWWRENKDRASERLVRVKTIKQTPNPYVWNVIWEEQDWKDGRASPWRRVNGDFTFEHRPPRTTADIFKNKLGLFVVHMLFAPETPPERNR